MQFRAIPRPIHLASSHLEKTKRRVRVVRGTFLTGFAKVVYIHRGVSGRQVDFVGRVKAMQRLALKVRYEERLDLEKYGRLKLGCGDGLAGVDTSKDEGTR